MEDAARSLEEEMDGLDDMSDWTLGAANNRPSSPETLARFNAQMAAIRDEHTEKEKARYRQDLERRELEAELRRSEEEDGRKEQRLARNRQELIKNPSANLVTNDKIG